MSGKLGTPVNLLYVPQVPAHAQQHHFQLGGNAFFQQTNKRKRNQDIWIVIKLCNHILHSKVKAVHSQRGQETSLVPPELQNKHLVRSFFWPKIPFPESKIQIFVHGSLPFFHDPDYPANKSLFAGLIRQISPY